MKRAQPSGQAQGITAAGFWVDAEGPDAVAVVRPSGDAMSDDEYAASLQKSLNVDPGTARLLAGCRDTFTWLQRYARGEVKWDPFAGRDMTPRTSGTGAMKGAKQ